MKELIDKINESYKNENELSSLLLRPLFERMGFTVEYLHGPLEQGKDFVISTKEKVLGKIEYFAVVVKKGDVNTQFANEITSQVRLSFGSSFSPTEDLSRPINVTKVYVVFSGYINEYAKPNFLAGLESMHLRNTIIINGNSFVNLIKKHWPEYFDPKTLVIENYLNDLREELIGVSSIPFTSFGDPIKLDDIWVEPKIDIIAYTRSASNYLSNPKHKLFGSELDFIIDKNKDINSIDILKFISLKFKKTGPSNITKWIINHDIPISIIFEGNAGIGKSTILKMVTADESQKIDIKIFPIFIKLRDFVGSAKTIKKYISDYLIKKEINNDFILSHLLDFKFLVALDGLDEILISKDRDTIITEINRYISSEKNAIVIIATRKADILTKHPSSSNSLYLTAKVNNFNTKQIRSFITKWTRNSSEAIIRFTKIKEDSNILEIAKRPLILTMLMILLDQNKPLPKLRAVVYEQCIDVLLDWDRLKGMGATFENRIKERVLSNMAYKLFENKKLFLEEKMLENTCKTVLGRIGNNRDDNYLVLMKEIQRSEILVPAPPLGFSFLYQSFYEFLVAKYLFVNDLFHIIEKNYYIRSLKEIFLLYAGLSQAEENPLLKIEHLEDDIRMNKHLLLYDLTKEVNLEMDKSIRIKNKCIEIAHFFKYSFCNSEFSEFHSKDSTLESYLIKLTHIDHTLQNFNFYVPGLTKLTKKDKGKIRNYIKNYLAIASYNEIINFFNNLIFTNRFKWNETDKFLEKIMVGLIKDTKNVVLLKNSYIQDILLIVEKKENSNTKGRQVLDLLQFKDRKQKKYRVALIIGIYLLNIRNSYNSHSILKGLSLSKNDNEFKFWLNNFSKPFNKEFYEEIKSLDMNNKGYLMDIFVERNSYSKISKLICYMQRDSDIEIKLNLYPTLFVNILIHSINNANKNRNVLEIVKLLTKEIENVIEFLTVNNSLRMIYDYHCDNYPSIISLDGITEIYLKEYNQKSSFKKKMRSFFLSVVSDIEKIINEESEANLIKKSQLISRTSLGRTKLVDIIKNSESSDISNDTIVTILDLLLVHDEDSSILMKEIPINLIYSDIEHKKIKTIIGSHLDKWKIYK